MPHNDDVTSDAFYDLPDDAAGAPDVSRDDAPRNDDASQRAQASMRSHEVGQHVHQHAAAPASSDSSIASQPLRPGPTLSGAESSATVTGSGHRASTSHEEVDAGAWSRSSARDFTGRAGDPGPSGASAALEDPDDEPWIAPHDIPRVRSALTGYRVMAYVVGTLLILLVCVGMPLKYAADMPTMVSVVGVAHGWLYALLLVTAFILGRRAGWPITRVVVIALAGTVPFLSFVAEYYARKDVRARIAAAQEYWQEHPWNDSLDA